MKRIASPWRRATAAPTSKRETLGSTAVTCAPRAAKKADSAPKPQPRSISDRPSSERPPSRSPSIASSGAPRRSTYPEFVSSVFLPASPSRVCPWRSYQPSTSSRSEATMDPKPEVAALETGLIAAGADQPAPGLCPRRGERRRQQPVSPQAGPGRPVVRVREAEQRGDAVGEQRVRVDAVLPAALRRRAVGKPERQAATAHRLVPVELDAELGGVATAHQLGVAHARRARVIVRAHAADRGEHRREGVDLTPQLPASGRERRVAAVPTVKHEARERLVVEPDPEALGAEAAHHLRVGGPPAEVPGRANPGVELDLRHHERRARMLVDIVAEDQLAPSLVRPVPHPVLERVDPVALGLRRQEQPPVLVPAGAGEGPREASAGEPHDDSSL